MIHSPLVAKRLGPIPSSSATGILDRYVFRKKLRDTLYGETALYQDKHLQKLVVLKRLSFSLLEQEDPNSGVVKENPLNEQAVIQLLEDPLIAHAPGYEHVVAYERDGFFAVEDSVFVAMEFCPGGDLYDYVTAQASQRLEETEALSLFAQIAKGLSFLHASGVAHRDLSLENVLLNDGQVKICDFGLSTEAHECPSEPVGKFYYMAPEVMEKGGGLYDPKAADVWSLGVLLFILLTGSPLFVEEKTRASTFRILQKYGVGKILELWGFHQYVSKSTIKFLTLLLQVEPLRRVSAEDVAHHPLLQTLPKDFRPAGPLHLNKCS
uniref:Protein kinase domain-containing protein n=1 Tax=Hyaloperonospora arabidopsidis (strain Emoy2) TaxID=559515 RepID=M4BC31_HYAAE